MSLTVNPDSPIIGHFMKPCTFLLTSHITLLHQSNWCGAVPVFTSVQELQFKSPLLLEPTRDGNISPVCTGAASHVNSCPVQLTRVMSHRWELEGLLSCRTHTPSPHSEGCWAVLPPSPSPCGSHGKAAYLSWPAGAAARSWQIRDIRHINRQ